jgi:glutamate carboxypeptidase
VHGIAAHASRCQNGANAIAEAAHKILRLEEMKDAEGITCNCGIVRGGTTSNSVAAECEVIADLRYATAEEEKQARERVSRIAQEVYILGCHTELSEIGYRPAMPLTEANLDLLRKMNAAYEAAGLPTLCASASTGGSDAAYTTLAGIPTIDSLGTEGEEIHSVRESIRIASLAESAKRIAVAVLGL